MAHCIDIPHSGFGEYSRNRYNCSVRIIVGTTHILSMEQIKVIV